MALAHSHQHFNATEFEFSWPLRVYWEDTDAGGIVFYANYLKFFERARTEWLRSLGLSQQALREATGGFFVVTETHVQHHRPARLDDALRITTRLTQMGRASLVLQQVAWRDGGSTCPDQPAPPNAQAQAQTLPPSGTPGAAAHSKPGERLAEGEIRIGWVDAQTLKPCRLPAVVTQALGAVAPPPPRCGSAADWPAPSQ